MKKLNIFFLVILATTFIMFGCKKSFLQRTPFTSLTPDQALKDVSGLNDAVSGAYAGLRSVSNYGRDFVIIGDLMADNIYVEKKNSGRYLIQYNYTTAVSDGIAAEMWQQSYTTIMRANRIIDASVSDAGAAQAKSEAYAIRALSYFNLINLFAKPYTDDPNGMGVPLITKYDPFVLPGRSKVSDIYNQIVIDLKTALQTPPVYVNSTRFSKYSIEALLAKVYLFMGDNINALASAKDVITNSGFSLVPAGSFKSYFANPAFSTNKMETLLEIDADAVNNNGFNDYAGMYDNGYNDMYCSSDLYNLYSNTDVRKSVIEPGTAKIGSPAFIVTKFPNATNADRDNIKVLRLSDVYLIAAEASLPNDEPGALGYLNTLMLQRDPSFAGYTSTGAALLNDIITERRKELAFEGDRFFTLNRLKWPIVRANNPAAIPAPLTIAYPFDKRVQPIPQVETLANPNIAGQQNPGY